MPFEDLAKRADPSRYDDSVTKDMPDYPGLALTSHVMLKTVQLGSLGGSVASIGVWLKSPDRSLSSLVLRQWPRCAGIGGAAGIVLTLPILYGKMRTVDLEGLEDRSYRLALNTKVKTMDFYSAIGGITSLLVGFSTRRMSGGTSRTKAAASLLVSRAVSPWSLMAQGISAGTLVYLLGHATGLPVQKPLELLHARGFEEDDDGGEDVGDKPSG